jgi:hypothetical protein
MYARHDKPADVLETDAKGMQAAIATALAPPSVSDFINKNKGQ